MKGQFCAICLQIRYGKDPDLDPFLGKNFSPPFSDMCPYPLHRRELE